jgi:hypothetical protein
MGNAFVIFYLGNNAIIWILVMLLFLFLECCYYLNIWNAVVIWVVGMLLIFVYWECFYYLGIWNAVVICIFGMMLLFGYLE